MLHMAGFEVWDINMEDLCTERINLDQFRGLVFVGGFSYADVCGSAKGLDSLELISCLHNETASKLEIANKLENRGLPVFNQLLFQVNTVYRVIFEPGFFFSTFLHWHTISPGVEFPRQNCVIREITSMLEFAKGALKKMGQIFLSLL